MNDEPEEGGESASEKKNAEAPKRRSGLKTLLFFVLPPIAVVIGGGYFLATHFGWFGEDPAAAAAAPAVYFDLPEMVVNLSAKERRGQYLKIRVALEARDKEAIMLLKPIMPRILDMFQIFLRELRSSDLEGSAGMFRLKEELLKRINLAIHPNRIDRVLFKEIIVQ